MVPAPDRDAWVCYRCERSVGGMVAAATDDGVPDVADCECGHPKRVHGSAGCCARVAGGGMCPCSEFRLGGSKVQKMGGSCYICGHRDHASGACPYFPHRAPSRKGPS